MKRGLALAIVLLAMLLACACLMGAKIWRFDGITITSGTTSANAINFGSDVAVYRDASARIANANKTYLMDDVILGSATTKTITVGGRLVLRTLGADPLDATPGNRPAGTVNEIAVYSGGIYLCTNASTPTWVLIGPAA